MRFAGTIVRAGRYWAVEVRDLGVYTQGTSKADAYRMAAEALEIVTDTPGFRAEVFPGDGSYFEIGGSPEEPLFALLLRQKRVSSGLSLAEVARRLGLRSRNAYARYEQGKSVPTVTKLTELLSVLDPGHDIVFAASRA